MDRTIAEQATEICLDRHPMLAASIDRDARGRLVWIPAPDRSSVLQWADEDDAVDAFPSFDIEKEPAVRAKVVNREDSCEMLFQIHHAAVDGIGALAGVQDWLTIYANLVSSKDPLSKLNQLDPASLKNRGCLGVTKLSYLKTIPFQWIAIYGAFTFYFQKAASLTPHAYKSNEGDWQKINDQLISRPLASDVAAAVSESAECLGVTKHEFIVSRLFLAISRWREMRGWNKNDDRCRIIVPANLRDLGDRRLPAANRMTMHYVDRVERELQDPAGLARGIRYEMGVINRFQLQKAFLICMRLYSWIPGLLKKASHHTSGQGTALITNLGSPWKRMKLPREEGKLLIGNLRIESVDLIPPLYQGTPVSFSLGEYADQTSLLLRFDPRVLSQADARELMAIFMELINEPSED